MNSRRISSIFLFILLCLTFLLAAGSSDRADAQAPDPPNGQGQGQGQNNKIEHKDRKGAAARAFQKGALNPLMLVDQPAADAQAADVQKTDAQAAEAQAVAAAALIDGAPHYFSHPNYANSPEPTVEGAVISVGSPLQDRAWASDTPAAVGELAQVMVLMGEVLPDGMIQSFQTWNQASAGNSPAPSAGNVFHAYVLRPTGVANEYTVVFDSGLLTVPQLTTSGVSEIATFPVANLAVQAGDRLAFYGQGVPVDVVAGGADRLFFPVLTAPLQDSNITIGSGDYPIYPDSTNPQERTYSFSAQVLDLSGQNTVITGGLRKFVNELPGLGAGAANNLGQYIPVAVPDTTTYPGSDYYIIELGEYTEQMHEDLPPTTLRGYRQAGGEYHYLGPAIVAQKDRPVRIL
ncbi:MAG: hypothetical protein PVH18_05730, partial [Chloroflexota bacterium]